MQDHNTQCCWGSWAHDKVGGGDVGMDKKPRNYNRGWDIDLIYTAMV